MYLLLVMLWVSAEFSGVYATSKLIVLHSPPSLKFQAVLGIDQDSLREMYCVALGLSTAQTSNAGDMLLINPFDTPEAAVELHIEGSTNIFSMYEKSKVFMLPGEDKSSDTFDYVQTRIKNLNMKDSKLVNMQLAYEHDVVAYQYVFGELSSDPSMVKRKTLVYAEEEDSEFLKELLVLKALVLAIKRNRIRSDQQMDFYHFKFNSLRALVDRYGPTSEKAKEATELLNEEIGELSKEFIRVYDGNVLFTVVMLDDDKRRLFRRQLGRYEYNVFGDHQPIVRQTGEKSGELSTPVLVNIVFFLCMALYLSVLAIVRVFMYMDPGRDSVVYRMTNVLTRIKIE